MNETPPGGQGKPTFWDSLTRRIPSLLPGAQPNDAEANSVEGREQLLAFGFALLLGFFLWLLVNMNRVYTMVIPVNIETGDVPEGKALAEPLPSQVLVSIEGEGWQLISLRSKKQTITVDVVSESVSLSEPVRQYFSDVANVSIIGVQPQTALAIFEPLITRKVPIRLDARLDYQAQFGPISGWTLAPDSVTISGPLSKVDPIEEWWSDSIRLIQVDDSIEEMISLRTPPPSVAIRPSRIEVTLDVAEFTEGEARVQVKLSGLPEGMQFTVDPEFVTIRYLVPIERYSDLKSGSPFEAYISYERIITNETGYLEPEILTLEEDVPLVIQNVNPSSVSYYLIVRE